MEKTIAMEFVTEIPLLLSKGLRRKYLLQYCCYVAILLLCCNRITTAYSAISQNYHKSIAYLQ